MRYLKWLMVIVFLFLLCDEGHCFGNKINEGGHDAITRHAAELAKKVTSRRSDIRLLVI